MIKIEVKDEDHKYEWWYWYYLAGRIQNERYHIDNLCVFLEGVRDNIKLKKRVTEKQREAIERIEAKYIEEDNCPDISDIY